MDHPLDARQEPSALERWILEVLYCDPKGSRAFLRIISRILRKSKVFAYVGLSQNLKDHFKTLRTIKTLWVAGLITSDVQKRTSAGGTPPTAPPVVPPPAVDTATARNDNTHRRCAIPHTRRPPTDTRRLGGGSGVGRENGHCEAERPRKATFNGSKSYLRQTAAFWRPFVIFWGVVEPLEIYDRRTRNPPGP